MSMSTCSFLQRVSAHTLTFAHTDPRQAPPQSQDDRLRLRGGDRKCAWNRMLMLLRYMFAILRVDANG